MKNTLVWKKKSTKNRFGEYFLGSQPNFTEKSRVEKQET